MNKKTFFLSLIMAMGVIVYSFLAFEPQEAEATDAADSAVVSVTVTAEIAISHPVDFSLGSIPGMTGGSASASTTWTVTTTDSSGYALTLKKGGLLLTGAGGSDKQFSDYVTSTSPEDYTWSAPAAGAEVFGFAVTSTDAVTNFKNTGAACGSGTISSNYVCWAAVPTTPSTITIASRASATPGVTGIDTIVNFKAEAGTSNNLNSGTYTTTVTATATTNS